MSVFGSVSVARLARPTVPPAPPMFVTGALPTSSVSVSTWLIARAVASQPPPGSAGAMTLTALIAAGAAASPSGASEPVGAPVLDEQAASVSAAAPATPMRTMDCQRVLRVVLGCMDRTSPP